MVRNSLCLFITFFALYAPTALSEPGFFRIDDVSIPAPVRQAAQSVFKLKTPDSETHRPAFVIDMQTEKENYRHSFGVDSYQQAQFEFCERTALRYCAIFLDVGNGSAFLAEDHQSIFSALHNVSDLLAVQVEKQKLFSHDEIRSRLLNVALPLVMQDHANELVFSSKANMAVPRFLSANRDIYNLKMGDSTFKFRLSDLIRMSVASPIGKNPLQISARPPKVGDRVYGIGYPAATFNRKADFHAQDSDGVSLWISKGHVISTEEFIRRTGYSFPEVVKTAFDEYMVLVDFDVEHGDSGGPIVNEDGEVIGIMQALFEDSTVTPHAIMSGGLKVFSEERLKKLWDRF